METPGSLVDKLSIVNLKIYHQEDIAHNPETPLKEVGRAKLIINDLNNQRTALIEEIDTLMIDLMASRTKLKVFKQHKDYGRKDN